MCAFRTDALFTPSSYRGWNGTAFETVFADPYTQPAPIPSAHVCQPIFNTTEQPAMHASPRRIVWSDKEVARAAAEGTTLPEYIFFSDFRGDAVASMFSFESDFAKAATNWSNPVILPVDLQRYYTAHGQFHYPTLLDVASPQFADNSYATVTNESAYVYLTISRVLYRRHVVFKGVPPPAPPPPAPPLPANCSVISVSGAGIDGYNGEYTRQSHQPRQYVKDSGHWIYAQDGVWRMGHYAVDVAYTNTVVNTSTPKAMDWYAVKSWGVPNPLVSCSSL